MRNPTRGIEFSAQQLLSPRELSTNQRYILKELIETEDLRGKAMFALGYYAGCRASDVCWFQLDQVRRLTKKSGEITIGYKRGQLHILDLANEARKALLAYLEEERNYIQTTCPFVFLSQRKHVATTRHLDHPERLTEGGLHAWWRSVKERASRRQWEEIADITFHDLRHDFAHRARQADRSLEEVASYLGHTTKKGTPAIGTTARYTQVSREQVQGRLFVPWPVAGAQASDRQPGPHSTRREGAGCGLYILEFHERNLYKYTSEFERAFCFKKRVAPARFGLPSMGREESGSENRPEHGTDSAHGIV